LKLLPTKIEIKQVLSYYRGSSDQQLLVIHNLSNESLVINLEKEEPGFTSINFQSVLGIRLLGFEITLPPYATVVLSRKL